MKKILFFLLSLSLVLLAEVRDLDIATFEKMKTDGVPVIDIRTPAEWRETGIIPGSRTITFFQPDGRYDVPAFLKQLEALGIDKKKPFILVCRSASRTRMLGNFLSERVGYEHVYQLAGGILNWRRQGKPLVPYRP